MCCRLTDEIAPMHMLSIAKCNIAKSRLRFSRSNFVIT
jgi:hypothetical protein